MSRKQLLLIGSAALLLGALLSHSVCHRLQSKKAVRVSAGVDVVVAANDLHVGRRVADEDVKVVKIPMNDVPANWFHDKSMVIGRAIILPIAKRDPLLPSKLGGYSDPVMLLGAGMRAVSICVSGVVGVVNSVQSGARVDVLVIRIPRSGGKQQSTTVLKDVTVIATGQNFERNSKGDTQTCPIVTLLLLPDDAQKLTSASLKGRSQLLLRTR